MGAARAALLSRPRLCLAGLVAASTTVRTIVAMWRQSPLYYSDEYLYSSLARSIASTGVPRVRGAFVHFPALLAPYLASPAWLIHDVDVAYRVALGLGSLWFSLAAVPAYALARRLGVTTSGSLFVSLLTLLVPDAAFTTTLLAEPYAYPAFLTTVFVSVEAIAFPARRRQMVAVALMAVLCLFRVQFVVFPAAYLIAVVMHGRSLRALRKQQLVLGSVLAVACVVAAAGVANVAGVYSGITAFDLPVFGTLRWFGVNAFVLFIAAGWVVLPGAIVGFDRFRRSGQPLQRSFVSLVGVLFVFLIAQAAFFGANESRAHERYTFYLAPLLAIAFVAALESASLGSLYFVAACAAAAVAIVVPAGSAIRSSATDESPTILGLHQLAGGGDIARFGWALALAAAAVLVAVRIGGTRLPAALAVLILLLVGASGTRELLRFGDQLGFQLGMRVARGPVFDAPRGTALVTSPETNRFLLMQTLFWNPNITRVLDLDAFRAPDGYASTPVRIGMRQVLVDSHGGGVFGPFVFDSDTTAASVDESTPVFERLPQAIVFGMNRDDGYLETVSRLVVTAGDRPLVVSMWLASRHGAKTMSFACGADHRATPVSRRARQVRIAVQKRTRLTCRISLISGAALARDGRTVSVEATRLAVTE